MALVKSFSLVGQAVKNHVPSVNLGSAAAYWLKLGTEIAAKLYMS